MGKNTSVVLSQAQEDSLKKMVESGRFGSVSEAIRAGMDALMERDAAVDRWLREEALPVYDAMLANPDLGMTVDEAFDAVLAPRREPTKNAA
jgi:antitoxin ParD1/3/4